jgi:hypothetical protein
VRQHPQQDLLLLIHPPASAQGRAQQTLVPREPALDLPPLAVDPAVRGALRLASESLDHLAAVAGLRPLPARIAAVQREDRRADAQPLAGQSVVMLSVEGAVAQQRVDPTAAASRPRRRPELRRVLTRAPTDVGRQEQVAAGLQDGRQLGPGALPPTLAGPLGAPGEIAADVPGLVPRRVDGRPWLGGDQAARPRRGDGLPEEGIGPPFTSSRSAAFCIVEWSGTLVRPRASRRSPQSRSIASRPR